MNPKAMFKLTYGLYVVGVRNGTGFGGCVVDAVMQTTCTPDRLVMCCLKGTRTRECVQETKEFTLSVLANDTDPFVIANFGFQSARTVDKWANVPHREFHGLPVLDSCAACLYCRVTEIKDLGTHVLFFCDVADAEDGSGTALGYSEYQASWKPRVSAAFQAGPAARKTVPAAENTENKGDKKMDYKWVCEVCGYEYDGTIPFEELPDDYVCPVCGVGKDQFEKIEIKKEAKPSKEEWVCKVCGYVYDGDIPFEELPDDYVCPICGVGKDQFEKR